MIRGGQRDPPPLYDQRHDEKRVRQQRYIAIASNGPSEAAYAVMTKEYSL